VLSAFAAVILALLTPTLIGLLSVWNSEKATGVAIFEGGFSQALVSPFSMGSRHTVFL
jgi:hypothetical protein